jgi:hypothetical protein
MNGRVFEALAARLEHRDRCDLYHSALEVSTADGRFVIEQAPAAGAEGLKRGVVAKGSVGLRAAGRLRLLRYEIRCWRDGVIPDASEAVESPQRLSEDAVLARRLVELVPQVPTPTWGRDELRLGEMWNSNSVTSWLLACTGVDLDSIRFPRGGRAPGWDAGILMAARKPQSVCSQLRLARDGRADDPRLHGPAAGVSAARLPAGCDPSGSSIGRSTGR